MHYFHVYKDRQYLWYRLSQCIQEFGYQKMKQKCRLIKMIHYMWAKIEPKRRYEWLWAKRGRRRRTRGALRSSFNNLPLDHTNYMLCKGLKIYNRNILTRSSKRIFNPMRYTGKFSLNVVCMIRSVKWKWMCLLMILLVRVQLFAAEDI